MGNPSAIKVLENFHSIEQFFLICNSKSLISEPYEITVATVLNKFHKGIPHRFIT